MKTLKEYHHEHFAQLYLYAYGMSKDKEVAQEIIADVFLALEEKLHLMASDEDVGSFLDVGVRNKVLIHLQNKKACLN